MFRCIAVLCFCVNTKLACKTSLALFTSYFIYDHIEVTNKKSHQPIVLPPKKVTGQTSAGQMSTCKMSANQTSQTSCSLTSSCLTPKVDQFQAEPQAQKDSAKASPTSHRTCTYVLVTEKNRLICKGPSRHTCDFITESQGRTGPAMKIDRMSTNASMPQG